MHHTPSQSSNLSLRRAIFVVLIAILAVIIAILTLVPVSAPSTISGNDKLYHLIAFAALLIPGAFLYHSALYYLLPGAILFGGMIEILQPYVNRSGEWADLGADAIGAVIGVIIGLTLRTIFRTRKRAQELAE